MPFILIVIVNLFFERFKTYYLIDCRVLKKGLKFFLFNVLQIVINTGFSLYFLISLNGGAVGRMSGVMIGVIVTGTVALFLFIKEKKYFFSFKIEKAKVKKALKYCIPLIIGGYAYYPIGNIDRLFLERLGNTNEYGYYTIGLKIAGFAGTFFLALYQSFEPDYTNLFLRKDTKSMYCLFFSIWQLLHQCVYCLSLFQSLLFHILQVDVILMQALMQTYLLLEYFLCIRGIF